MKKVLLGAALTLAAAFNAQAADAASPFKFLVGAGLTFGGDTLSTVQFSDGSSEDIKGGGLFQLYGGVEYRLGDQVSFQGTVGYHVDDSSGASNGSVRFSRVPVDLLLYYHLNDKVRLGGGVQLVNGPELKGSGVASNVHIEFDNATGAILEGEYLFTPHIGLKVRYVSEKFEVKGTDVKADGNHLGVMLNYYF
jgi:opacity protein-like surface antigen